MARREINVFSLSFLDLLSGALGAVLILYIIVPKIDQAILEQVDALEELRQLEVQVEDIEAMMAELENSVPAEVLEPLEQELDRLRSSTEELGRAVENLQERLAASEARVEELEQQVEDLLQQNAESAEQLRAAIERAEDAERQAEQAQRDAEQAQRQAAQAAAELEECQANSSTIAGDLETCKAALAKTFVVLYIRWATQRDDVDLHVIDPTGAEFYYRRRTVSGRPGVLSEDNTHGPGNEVWEIREAEPGTYRVRAKLFSHASGQNIPVEGRVFYRDGSTELPQITLTTSGQMKDITSFTVDSDGNVTFH